HGDRRPPRRARRRALRADHGQLGLLRQARARHPGRRALGGDATGARAACGDVGDAGTGLRVPRGLHHLLLPELEVAGRHLVRAVMSPFDGVAPPLRAGRVAAALDRVPTWPDVVPLGTRRLLIGWLGLAVGSLVVAGIFAGLAAFARTPAVYHL